MPTPMNWSLPEIVKALQTISADVSAYYTENTEKTLIKNISTDSRTLEPGDLFVAIPGERYDGHQFVSEALARGASAILIAEPQKAHFASLGRVLVVPDTVIGLGKLAQTWRQRFHLPVVAITGSNGKTTVKEMVAHISRAYWGANQIWATAGNFNNQIGLPHTLFGLRSHHGALLLEIGMSQPGEIAYLTQIAQPTVALVNNAHAAHLIGLGSVEAIALEKGDVYRYLPPDGVGIVNADSPYAGLWRTLLASPHHTGSGSLKKRILTFSLDGKPADVSARYTLLNGYASIELCTPMGESSLKLAIPGLHNARNVLAAIAIGVALGIDLGTMVKTLSTFKGVSGRLQVKPFSENLMVLDDTYNANPSSVKAAIDVLASYSGQKIFVLGDMGELGPTSEELHATVGEYAKKQGIDRLYALGDHAVYAANAYGPAGQHFRQLADLLTALERELRIALQQNTASNSIFPTTILVKGSRFMRMERVVSAITGWAAPYVDSTTGGDPCCSG